MSNKIFLNIPFSSYSNNEVVGTALSKIDNLITSSSSLTWF